MDELISRKAAIDAFYKHPNIDWTTLDVLAKINALPSAQPEKRTHERTETHACDLISRAAAMEAIENTEWYHLRNNGVMMRGANSKEHQAWYKEQDIYKALEQLPSAQQRWIPCSERLPEKGGDYLTTLTDKDGNYVDVTEWQNIIGGRWIAPIDECDYCEIGNVVAWMPLPDPYREEGE